MPVDVSVKYEGETVILSFDVMPTFEQLHEAIRQDLVGPAAPSFSIVGTTLRGTNVAITSQGALNPKYSYPHQALLKERRPKFHLSRAISSLPPRDLWKWQCFLHLAFSVMAFLMFLKRRPRLAPRPAAAPCGLRSSGQGPLWCGRARRELCGA